MCMHIYIYIHIYTHVYIHVYTDVYVYVHVYIYIQARTLASPGYPGVCTTAVRTLGFALSAIGEGPAEDMMSVCRLAGAVRVRGLGRVSMHSLRLVLLHDYIKLSSSFRNRSLSGSTTFVGIP